MTVKVENHTCNNQRKVGFSEIPDLRQKSRLKSVGHIPTLGSHRTAEPTELARKTEILRAFGRCSKYRICGSGFRFMGLFSVFYASITGKSLMISRLFVG